MMIVPGLPTIRWKNPPTNKPRKPPALSGKFNACWARASPATCSRQLNETSNNAPAPIFPRHGSSFPSNRVAPITASTAINPYAARPNA